MFDQNRARGTTVLLKYEMYPGGKWRFRTRVRVVLDEHWFCGCKMNFVVTGLYWLTGHQSDDSQE